MKSQESEQSALPSAHGRGLAYRTLAAAAVEEIRHRILSGDWAGGTKLRQDALAAEFNVSRIPIREALLQLEAEGLVQIEPHKGAVVVEVRIEDIEELCALRALLEPRLLLHSAPRLTAQDYVQLNKICAEYSREMREKNVRRWGALNTELHQLLYRHAGQPRTAGIVEQLLRAMDRITRLQLLLTDGLARAEDEHARMVKLCQEGRFEAAADLLCQHIENVGASLATRLDGHNLNQQAPPKRARA